MRNESEKWANVISTMKCKDSIVLRVTTEATYTKKHKGLIVSNEKTVSIEEVSRNSQNQK